MVLFMMLILCVIEQFYSTQIVILLLDSTATVTDVNTGRNARQCRRTDLISYLYTVFLTFSVPFVASTLSYTCSSWNLIKFVLSSCKQKKTPKHRRAQPFTNLHVNARRSRFDAREYGGVGAQPIPLLWWMGKPVVSYEPGGAGAGRKKLGTGRSPL